ncbi:MAG: hypothetical protein KAR06_02680 [Deltaproteobacteria bacterium]|nr:hypothetical protein [Deltaproteobacteria bacterium]
MTDLIAAFQKTKAFGGKLGKRVLIELYIDTYKEELIAKLRMALGYIKPEDVPKFVKGHEALPIPPKLFSALKGYEGYLETVSPERIFNWIAEARPEIGQALLDLGEECVIYIANFKAFIIDSIKAAPDKEAVSTTEEQPPAADSKGQEEKPQAKEEGQPQTEEREKPQVQKVWVHCTSCDERWEVPQDEVESIKECPFCGEPT